MRKRARLTIERGIRHWKGGLQAYVRVHGRLYAESFPAGTDLQVLRDWRTHQGRRHGQTTDDAGSFGADIATYLSRVDAMPTFKQRAAHLELWARALGRDRPTDSITATEIDQIMQGWLTTPSRPEAGTKGRPSGPHGIDPQTVRKRRTALQSFFVKRHGKTGRNPVKGATNFPPPKPEAREIDYLTIARILAAMPTGRSAKPGAVQLLSLGKIRATVLAYTGMPPGVLGQVVPTDLSLVAATVRIRPRKKGEGVEARTLPLLADGLEAFRAFHQANAYGRFSVEALNQGFKRAARRIGLEPSAVTLYDLRHSFGAALYRVTKDLATVGRFLLHAEGSPMTARYAKGANQDVDAAAAAAMSLALSTERRQALKSVPETGRKLSRKVVPSGKSRVRKQLRAAV